MLSKEISLRSKKWRNKEFPTETLTQTQVDRIIFESDDYEKGLAPVSRNTQQAESLEDMAELQKAQHARDNMRKTHNYGTLEPDHSAESSADSSAGGDDHVAGDVTEDAEAAGDHDAGNNNHDAGNGAADDAVSSDHEAEAENMFELQPLSPDDENYDNIIGNYEDIMEKMSSNPTKPKYWFKEQGDHWFCSCGQLNKGDRCVNCGLERDLLRALFFLHEPGEEPGRYEGMNVNYTEVSIPDKKPRLSKTVLIAAAIAVVAALLAAGGLFGYYYIVKPSMEEQAAENVRAAGESIKSNVVLCSSDFDSFMRRSYISTGNECCNIGSYEQALKFYYMAGEIMKSDDLNSKIYDAKYGYVAANKAEGGEKFEEYLSELIDIGYGGAQEIYDEFYAWKFSIVANLDPEDYSTDITTASRKDIVYFHVSVSGGPPGESIDVYYEATWPKGYNSIGDLGEDWVSGSKGTARFFYPVPIMSRGGELTFKIYNKSTQELLGSDSIKFEK